VREREGEKERLKRTRMLNKADKKVIPLSYLFVCLTEKEKKEKIWERERVCGCVRL